MNRIELLNQSRNDIALRTRFESKIAKQLNGCWTMNTHHDHDGYPLFWFKDNNVRGAQVSVVLYTEHSIVGTVICHTCDVVGCVNPEHLTVATNKHNTRDMLSKKRGGMQKITESQVLEIYEKSIKYKVTNKTLAVEYAISASTICNILKGRNWEWMYDRYLAIAAEYRTNRSKA